MREKEDKKLKNKENRRGRMRERRRIDK